MAYSWITPKTDWTTSTHFTYTDYNRIRNNLLFLNDKINELFPDKAKTLDLGDALTGYTDNYYPSQFNAFEDALESFTRAGQNVNIGTKGVYKGNEPFIMADALNRIEKCCLKWYNYQPYITGALISPTTFNLSKDETVQLTISVVPSDAQYSVVWLSSNNSVATVSNGLVTGVSSGSVTITAIIQQSGAKDIEVTATGVVIVKATSISFAQPSLNLTFKEPYEFSLIVEPSDATNKDNYTIESSDTSIVTVTKGFMKANAISGDAVITAKLDGLTATQNIKVMVNENIFTAGTVVYNDNYIDTFASSDDMLANYFYDGTKWYKGKNGLPEWGQYSSFVMFNNELHMLGGSKNAVANNHHWKWNLTKWDSEIALPYNADMVTPVVFNGELHILGGRWGAQTKHYKLNGNSWSKVSTLPFQLYDRVIRAVVYNNEIHVLGFNNSTKSHYKWNGSSWVSVSTLPLEMPSVVVFNNQLHIFGSNVNGTDNASWYEHYVWNGNSWVQQENLKYGAYHAKAVVWNGHIYCFDGGSGTSSFRKQNAYNMFIVE